MLTTRLKASFIDTNRYLYIYGLFIKILIDFNSYMVLSGIFASYSMFVLIKGWRCLLQNPHMPVYALRRLYLKYKIILI